MANPLPEEKELYERIRREGIAITHEIWDFVYRRVTENTAAIILICQRWLANKEAMPVQEAERILVWTKDIKNTISAVSTPSKESPLFPQFQNVSSLDPIVEELIAHQFGNDIYAIELMVKDAIDYINPTPVSLEVLEKIIVHAYAISGFLEKFRTTVQWKESEEKYHNLYDSFRDGLLMADMQGHILDANQSYAAMLKYGKEEITKLTCQQLTPEKWKKSEEEFLNDLVAKRSDSVEYEKEYIKKDGTIFPVSQKVWLIKDEQGYPLGMWGIVRDVTERKKAQREFEEEIFATHSIIDNISTGLSLSDTRGRFVIFNHRMQEITGYTIEEINTQDLGVLLYPDLGDRQKAISRLSEITAEKGTSNVETFVKAKNGSQRILSVSTSLINYKGSEMFLSIWRDITESKRLEDALKDSETRFRRLFETAQDGILILDAGTGQIREVNPFLIDMLDYSREEFLGRKLWEVGAFIDTDKSKAAFSELQAKGYVRYEDLPLRTKDGRLINVEFVSNVYQVDHTKVIQCNIRDITDRKRLSIELSEVNSALMAANVRLEQLALKDSHTGLYNHRYLKEAIEVSFSRAQRHVTSLSVIMMDIDYFKSINDVYGHVFGDLILKQFAAVLTKTVRPYDVVIRYGGEEFIVLSADTDRAGAQALAERILEKVGVFSFGDKSHSVKLKLSLGVATYPQDSIQASAELMDCADQILNKAKENGGNRVYSSLDIKKGDGAAENFSDIDSLKEKIGKLTLRANQSLIEETLAFAKTIKLKDHYTGTHVERTVSFAAKISQELHFPNDKIELIKEAAVLHDLGKVGIAEHILQKKSKLSSEEFEEIKKHPQIVVDIIRPIHSLHTIIPFLLYHHERWDGLGYPHGLAGQRIPLGARIIAIADVYQALVSDRPYRKAYSKEKAIAIVRNASGTQFDSDIVKAFSTVLQRE